MRGWRRGQGQWAGRRDEGRVCGAAAGACAVSISESAVVTIIVNVTITFVVAVVAVVSMRGICKSLNGLSARIEIRVRKRVSKDVDTDKCPNNYLRTLVTAKERPLYKREPVQECRSKRDHNEEDDEEEDAAEAAEADRRFDRFSSATVEVEEPVRMRIYVCIRARMYLLLYAYVDRYIPSCSLFS